MSTESKGESLTSLRDSPQQTDSFLTADSTMSENFNVLIGCTGSVASIKVPLLVEQLLDLEIKVFL